MFIKLPVFEFFRRSPRWHSRAQALEGDREEDGGSFSNFALCPNPAAMCFDDSSRHRQAKSCSRHVIACRCLDAEILIKEGDQIFWRNTHALVGYANDNVAGADLASYDDQPTLWRVLEGIVKDVT